MASEQLHRPTTETCQQNQNTTQEQQNWFKRNMPLIATKQKDHSTTSNQPTQVKEHHYHPSGWWPGQKQNTATTITTNHAPQDPCQKTATATKTTIVTNTNPTQRGPCQKTTTAATKTTITNTNHAAPEGICQNSAPKITPNPLSHQTNMKEHVVYGKNYTIAEPVRKDHAVYGRNYTVAEHVMTGNNTGECNSNQRKENREQQNANHCFRSVAGHVKQRLMMRGGHNDAPSDSSDSSDSECETEGKKKEKRRQKVTIIKVTSK